jgi:ubiquinone biosynthesis protein
VVQEVAAIALRHRLQLPSDFTLLARVVAMCEGLGAQLDPGFRLKDVAEPYFQRFWLRARSPETIARSLLQATEEIAELGSSLPRRLRRLLEQLERGEITVTSRFEEPRRMLAPLARAVDRVAASILASGVLIALCVVLVIARPALPSAVGELFAGAALGAGAVILLALLFLLWRSGR